MKGKVWLVGAGPGDRGLFTLNALEVLQNAEVVVYDALVGDEVLAPVPERADLINVGKRAGNHLMEQDRINRTLLEQALAGRRVVRLKGGDPFLFGRGGEELELLAENGIPYEVVPGVTSAFAVPAYNGIPVTPRDFTSSVHIITGHRRKNSENSKRIDYEALVRSGGTLIFLMGVSSLPSIAAGLLEAGMEPDMPAAVLERGTTSGQRRVVATISTLAEEAARAGIGAPAVIVVGRVCALADRFAWAENRPLAGKKILVTRPKEQISETAARLRRLGAEVLECPAIETVPIEPDTSVLTGTGQDTRAFGAETASSAAVNILEGYFEHASGPVPGQKEAARRPDWLVFTSPAGVRIFMEAFLEHRDVRDLCGSRIAAIGGGTAKALRQYGIRADFVPSVYDGETLGRELAQKIRQERAQGGQAEKPGQGIDAAAKQADHDRSGRAGTHEICGGQPVRILIPRAAAGNPDLVRELEQAGDVEIRDLAIYETKYRTSGIIDVRDEVLRGEIDFAVFTSASTVRGFCAMMKGAENDPAVPDLSGVRAVCIGRQTKAAADAAGMRTWMARRAAIDDLVDAVVRACDPDNPF